MSMLQIKMCCGTGGRRIESRTGRHQRTVAGEAGSRLTVVESSGCAEGLVLAQVADGDVGELALGLLDEGGHLGVVVEADDDDFGEVWHFGEGLERVPYHGLPSDGQQRFGACNVSAGG